MELRFKLTLKPPESTADIQYPPRYYRRGWTHQTLLSVLPESGITTLDVGSGPTPLQLRSQDRVTTVDMSAANDQDAVIDVTKHYLPMFRAVSSACVMSINFSGTKGGLDSLVERCINLSWGLTERWLGFIVGRILEVQFMFQKLSPETEARFRTVPMENQHLTGPGGTKCI